MMDFLYTLSMRAGKDPHGVALATFVMKAIEEFGTSYDYRWVRPDLPVHFPGGRPKQFLREGEALTGEAVFVDAEDREWFFLLQRAAFFPGTIIGRTTETADEVQRFSAYLARHQLGTIEKKTSWWFGRTLSKVTLNARGRQRAWDLLRLFWWPSTIEEITVSDSTGATVYHWPPVDTAVAA